MRLFVIAVLTEPLYIGGWSLPFMDQYTMFTHTHTYIYIYTYTYIRYVYIRVYIYNIHIVNGRMQCIVNFVALVGLYTGLNWVTHRVYTYIKLYINHYKSLFNFTVLYTCT